MYNNFGLLGLYHQPPCRVTRLLKIFRDESPASFDRVTCLSLKNASAPWGLTVPRWPSIIISWVSYIQYLFACQKMQRSNPYNMVKSGLTWRRVFRRRHLGRRVTAVTCLRWPTVIVKFKPNFEKTLENKRESVWWWQISSKTLVCLGWGNLSIVNNLYFQNILSKHFD